MPSERFRDFFTTNQMAYAKAQLFYEQLRYVVGDETMRGSCGLLRAAGSSSTWTRTAFREVAEQVSRQDVKWLIRPMVAREGPLIDYSLKRVRRSPRAERPLADVRHARAEGATASCRSDRVAAAEEARETPSTPAPSASRRSSAVGSHAPPKRPGRPSAGPDRTAGAGSRLQHAETKPGTAERTAGRRGRVDAADRRSVPGDGAPAIAVYAACSP